MPSDTSIAEQLARAVADDLTTRSSQFAMSFLARYMVVPQFDLTELDKVVVVVRDVGQRLVNMASRSQSEHEYDIELMVRTKADAADTLRLSQLKKLAEQLSDAYRFESPAGWTGTERFRNSVLSDFGPDEALREQGVGGITITHTFVGWRT